MSHGSDRSRLWLFSSAKHQRGQVAVPPLPYDDARQITVVEENGALVAAVERYPSPQTKKADIEKGEDQKDRW